MKYQYPIKNHKVTCEFGKTGSWQCGWHIGVDLVGDREIFPIAEGVVESLNSKGASYGNHIVIKHDDGMISLYAHLSEVKVKAGQKVSLDTLLGTMGATGNATGVHLHLELHNGAYKYPPNGSNLYTATWIINPLAWIEDHIGGGDMPEVKDLQVWSKETGQAVIVKAVNIDGSNYVRLRDIEKLTRLEVSFVDGKVYVG